MTSRTQRTFLVTGGSGLLGSRLVRRLLEEGQRVRVLDTRIGELGDVRRHPNLEFVGVGTSSRRGGMMDKRMVYRATRNVSVIYHLAINWNGHGWRHHLFHFKNFLMPTFEEPIISSRPQDLGE